MEGRSERYACPSLQNEGQVDENNPLAPFTARGTVCRERVTLPEILQEMLQMKRTDTGNLSLSRQVGAYLNSLPGWEKSGVYRHPLYGIQKSWVRLPAAPSL